jgi:Flp pilus assembly protein TadD
MTNFPKILGIKVFTAVCIMASAPVIVAQGIDRGQRQAALIFQILASELALNEGELGVAAATYLTLAQQTRDPGAARRATELLIQARAPQQALEAAEIWLAANPKDAEAQTTVDLIELVLGQTDKLVSSLVLRRDAARKDDKLDSFYDYLAGLAGRAADPAAGAKLYGTVSAPDAKRPNVLYTQAMLHERAGNAQAMEQLLRELIALDPMHAHAHNALGYHLADRNERLEEALALIERALGLAPNDAHIIDSMGWIQFRLGNLDLAEKYLRAAFVQQPDTEISTHLGEVLWVKGKTEEAESLWRAAFANDPRNELLQKTLKRLGVSPMRVHPE